MKIYVAALAGLLLLSACDQNEMGAPSVKQIADTVGVAGYSGAPVSAPAAGEQKLVKTAALQMQVADVQHGAHSLGVLARSLGGALRHQQVAAGISSARELPRGNDSITLLQSLAPTASLTFRLPSVTLDSFLYAASLIGSFVNSSELDIDDRTLSYIEAGARADARNRFLESPRSSPKVTGSMSALQIRDEAISQQLAQRAIDTDVAYSTVRLELTQPPLVRRSVIVNSNLDVYALPLSSRFADALAAGWGFFAGLLILIANLWVFLLVGLLGWVALWQWGKYKSRFQPAKQGIS